MKLKRDDLIKQFELLKKQEITNHNNQILSTNCRINEIESSVRKFEINFANSIAKFEHALKNIEAKFKGVTVINNTLEKSFDIQIDNLENVCLNIENETKMSVLDLHENKVETIDFEEFSNEINQDINLFRNELADLKIYLHQKISTHTEDMKRIFSEFKQELRERPEEWVPIREELEKKIYSANIDAKGIRRDMEIFRKDIFVIDKKIENLYTLIERLKNNLENRLKG